MPSLCIISDTHRKHRQLVIPECDILIHCGDFCNIGQEEIQTLEDVDVWFAELPARQIVCIGGNHDSALQHREYRFAHAQFLEDSLVEIEGLRIYGSPWCPELSSFAYYASEDMLAQRWRQIPEGLDILVTHTPPYGILDLPRAGSPHLGCPLLREELARIRPRLHIFGHVHASHGQHEDDTTRYINASVVGGLDFAISHAPVVIHLDGDS
jgi:Icc-related predicted phosphoesterase